MQYKALTSFTFDGIDYSEGDFFPSEGQSPEEIDVKILLDNFFIKELDSESVNYIINTAFTYNGKDYTEGQNANELVGESHFNTLLNHGFLKREIIDSSILLQNQDQLKSTENKENKVDDSPKNITTKTTTNIQKPKVSRNKSNTRNARGKRPVNKSKTKGK